MMTLLPRAPAAVMNINTTRLRPSPAHTMRFKAQIQNIPTFTSTYPLVQILTFWLTLWRTHRVAELARPARMGQAQRGPGVLHHHT